jgi:hypothetical protein
MSTQAENAETCIDVRGFITTCEEVDCVVRFSDEVLPQINHDLTRFLIEKAMPYLCSMGLTLACQGNPFTYRSHNDPFAKSCSASPTVPEW